MEQARARGCRRVVGFEANGGFLTGSDLALGQGQLLALPTRDAVLPILAVLSKARQLNVSLSTLFDRLPHRFSRAGLLKRFPRVRAWAILEALSPKLEQIAASGGPIDRPQIHSKVLQRLDHYFGPSTGFALLRAIDLTDGLRLLFENGEVLHLRPSGNADEFRVYAVADSQPRADALVAMSLEEPLGLLRRLEQEL
jgi:phosphomannomutase